MSTVEAIQSAPEDLFLQPHGVLHVVTISCHMEYSIWSFLGAIWSTLGFTREVNFYCHMEYSIWLLFDAVWSTPYGKNIRPYGVHHKIVNYVYCWRNTKCSRRLISTTPWSTPCGHYFMPYGVLHMVSFWYHMEYLRIHHRDPCLLPHGVLHMAAFWCHMEYSMWSLFHAIWSTPHGWFLVPYGVLKDPAKRSIPTATWSTPYGCFLMPYGVLHIIGFWCNMEYFRI